MNKFFRVPFALSGDRAAVPDAADANGFVSYIEGYGPDYERAKTDVLSKNIERTKMNEVFYDITTAVAEIQKQGIPDFITSALNGGTPYSYAINAMVRYSNEIYISLVNANTALPTDATKWSTLANLSGSGKMTAVPTIAALKALDKTKVSSAYVLGYYAIADLGGGAYALDAVDVTTPDNGGTVIVATDGGRWKLSRADIVTVAQFGAPHDGTTNADAFFTAAVTALGYAYVPPSSQPFKINFAFGYDLSLLRGTGRVLWQTYTIDLSKTRDCVPKSQPEALIARYASGETGLGIVCYGDSITAGVNSTNYADNTGSPTYNSVVDHSWPVMASKTVRQMAKRNTSDTGFTFWNAGKAGQRMDDGWAFTNFQTYVLSPYGSAAQGLIIGFGVNDAHFSAGSATQAYIRELKNLVMLCRSYNLEPVIFSTLPIPRVRNDNIYREIGSMIRALATEFNIRVYDPARYFRQMIKGYGFDNLFGAGGDGVHPNDAGYNAWASCIVRSVAAPWVIDPEESFDYAPESDARTSGWPLSGVADASWAVGVTHFDKLNLDHLAVRYNPTLAGGVLGLQYFVWVSGKRNVYAVLRALTPPENTAPTAGITVRLFNLCQIGFDQPGSIYRDKTDVHGWRRTNWQTAVNMPSVVDVLRPGLQYCQIRTGADNASVNYLGGMEFVTGARHYSPQQAPNFSGTPEASTFPFGAMRWNLVPSGGIDCWMHPEEFADMTNVIQFTGLGSRLHMNAALPEGTGIILMGGHYINNSTGAVGRWAHFLYRSTGANNTKLFLFRWDSQNGLTNLTAAPTASAQALGTAFDVTLVFDKNGSEYRIRCFDGKTTAATLLWTYTSTAAAAGSTTVVEAPAVAGACFGGFALNGFPGGDLIINSAAIIRYQ